MTFQQFLTFLAGGAGSAAAFSWICERIPAFQKLTPEAKKNVSLVGTIVLSLGAYAFSVYVPVDVINSLAPWFAIIVGAVVAWNSNQEAHKIDKA